jgi:hypothetical protein
MMKIIGEVSAYLTNYGKTQVVMGNVFPILGTYVEPTPVTTVQENSSVFC